jgi:hypothetical protein
METKLTVNHRYTEDVKDDAGLVLHKKGEPIKAGSGYKTRTIPSRYEAPKNIVIMTPGDFEAIREDVDGLLQRGQQGKGLVKLDDIPSGYWDPAQQVADARGKMADALAKLEGAELKAMELEDEVKRLKGILVTFGWKDE